MKKHLFTFVLFLFATCFFSQSMKELEQTLVGSWVIEKMQQTADEKTITQVVKDTSLYTFSPAHTFTLSCSDIWGKANIVGKWETEGVKVKLFDMTHFSAHKGPLPGVIPEYYVELRKINEQTLLLFSSYDERLKLLHELYYKKREGNSKAGTNQF